MKSVWFIYGFAEGKWHGKRFRKVLRQRGFTIAATIPEADIIIAHSGGAFEVPELRDNQLLVLIGPPYWPGRAKVERGIAKIAQDFRATITGPGRFFNARKLIANSYYTLFEHKRTAQIVKDADTFDLEVEIKHSNTLLIRNNGDHWLTPDLTKLQKLNPHLKIHRLDGDHDDCWLRPARYIDLLQSDI